MAGVREPGLLAWLHLARFYQRMQRHEQALLRDYGLTLPQFDVLAHLYAADGITQQALAERLLVTKGNVCGILDRMAEDGLLERRADPNDRRANRLHLTDRGCERAAVVVPAMEAMITGRMAALNADERRILHLLMRRLDRSLAEA